MRTIARAHTSTHATSLMSVKIARATYVYDTHCLGQCNEKNERKQKHQIVDHFSLTFVNLALAWMSHFYEWLQNKGKFLGGEYYNQFGIYQPSSVSTILELREVNLSNPEAYSEPCKISKMKFFAKIVNG